MLDRLDTYVQCTYWDLCDRLFRILNQLKNEDLLEHCDRCLRILNMLGQFITLASEDLRESRNLLSEIETI